MVTLRCSECGAAIIPREEHESVVPSTPGILARYQRLSKCNEPPAMVDRSFVHAVASKTAARLTSLDVEISQLRARLKQLEEEQADLMDYQTQNHAILSPLRRMPPEVLTEIFLWTVPPIDAMNGDVSDLKQSPWTLSQVCSRWRAITLATPSLWSTICVEHLGGGVNHEMVRTQVGRSRMLKVHFYGDKTSDSAPQIELFRFLIEHSERWEQLEVQLTAALVSPLAALHGRLSSLRRLWVRWDTEDSEFEVGSIDSFEMAPLLSDVGLADAHEPSIRFLFPAHQLTCYRVWGPWDRHQNVLRLAPNLIEANISITCDDGVWPVVWPRHIARGAVIDMLHLQRLYVSDSEALAYLRAPALAEISIEIFGQQEDPRAIDNLDALFMRSSCTPRRLCLTGLPDAHITTKILLKYPFISNFALLVCTEDGVYGEKTLMNVVDNHLTMLTLRNSDVDVSPHLEEIHFGSVAKSSPNGFPLFLKMLKSRRSPHGALKTAAFLMRHGPELGPESLVELNLLKEAGLSLSVEWGIEVPQRLTCWTYECPWN